MKTLFFLLLMVVSIAAVSTEATAQDTIYVSHQAKSYLLFDEPVTLADVGNPSLYQARIENNSVLVVATEDSVADTPFYAVVGGKPFTARLLFHPHPEAFYDFRSDSSDVESTGLHQQTLTRLKELSSQSDLNYATKRENGIRFQLVGLVHDLSTTYLKFRIENHTSLVYRTDFVGFERLKRYKKGLFAKDQQARFPIEPLVEWQIGEVLPHQVLPYSEQYIYYALPMQPLERREAIVAMLRETKSGRSVSLKIPSRLIRRADLY